jgi:hypothetical protein
MRTLRLLDLLIEVDDDLHVSDDFLPQVIVEQGDRMGQFSGRCPVSQEGGGWSCIINRGGEQRVL